MMRTYDGASTVEAIELKNSGRESRYAPTEKTGIIEVDNFPLLGKLTAFRFIEWVLKNPGGVISLPTGKTPEHFIKWIRRILDRWETKEIRSMLEEYGIGPTKRPDMRSLTFVQIDEFYPMDSNQHNSFNYYVRKFYLKGFGLSPDKAMLIDATALGLPKGKTMDEVFPGGIVDLTLRVRQTRSELEAIQRDAITRVDWFCMEYERKIREMGGIGFFLGGIGPDGHIAFNVRGSSVYSVTRLMGTNYETQAAAAGDLGGIEISRNRLVITIGLSTITFNPATTAIIIASGDAKAHIVRRAIEEPQNPENPASVLQDLNNARFFLTKGAASQLTERAFIDFKMQPVIDERQTDDVFISLSLAKGSALQDLKAHDVDQDRFAKETVAKTGLSSSKLGMEVRGRLIRRLEKGLQPLTKTIFLHTEPHHDDIMLGYLPYLYHLLRDPDNNHFFANLTSGFTAVSNHYFLSIIRKLRKHLDQKAFSSMLDDGYFDANNQAKRAEEVYMFLDGTAARTPERKDEAEARRALRNCVEAFGTSDVKALRLRAQNLEEYLLTQYPGAKDPPDVQKLKGMLREWEVELLWAHFGIEPSAVFPLRLGFYQGDIFSEEPEVSRDVVPVFELMKKIKPNIVSVAFDPEGSGPDTHYKVLQAIAAAVRMYEEESHDSSIRIWGYRNVWYRFKPAEADIIIPVSLNTMALLNTSFMNCFGSQSAASFPSYEHDGPFSELAQKIYVDQYAKVKTCLGPDFFLRHPHPRLRGARGLIFLKEMSLSQFYEKVRELKKRTEAKE
jgi:glucosamine-6-phosphate deaminase